MDNINENQKNKWYAEHENILIEWADKAMCYRWLHSKAHNLFSYKNAWFTIPVIVISTCTGTANFAQDRVSEDYRNYVVMIVGAFNILAGIITTIQQFLKVTQLNEAHRVSCIAWGKFHRNIKMELSKRPDERMPVTNMLKISKEEFDRLMETSPTIPDEIVDEFNTTFPVEDLNSPDQSGDLKKNIMGTLNNYGEYSQFARPEVCDVLISTSEYKYSADYESQISRKIKDKIKEFVQQFSQTQGREPFVDEIKTYLIDNKLNHRNLDHIIENYVNNEIEIDMNEL